MAINITKEKIDASKKKAKHSLDNSYHQHDDCIRIAYEWLDAQHKIKTKCRGRFPLKHLIEKGEVLMFQRQVSRLQQLYTNI